jgi:two-component system sensor histidine kinase GlrK
MAESAASEPIYALSLARNTNALEGLLVDIERATRQFQVIQNDESNELVKSYLMRYRHGIQKLCNQINRKEICNNNRSSLDKLTLVYTTNETVLNTALNELNDTFIKLNNGASEHLDLRLAQQQANIKQVKTEQVWFTIILITTSLFMALLSSYKILAPVKRLEMMIKELAGNQHKLSAVSSSGPSELIDLEHKLHFLAKRLNQLENLRKTMLRHAAHELKTPLASIKEGCSLLSDQVLGHLNPDQLEVLSLLNSSGQRLENLIQQLLDYNILLQQSQARLEHFNLVEFFKSFKTENQLALQQHCYRLEIDFDIEQLYADKILFRRILDNLLSNAIAHGTPKTTISIRLFHRQGAQVLEFANKGMTINQTARETYFQPFQRGNHTRNDRVSGSGLGLSIVSECASLMMGNAYFIDVEYADVCVQVTIGLPKATT